MQQDPFLCAVFLVAAFVLAGLVHSAWLLAPVSRRLAIPLDAGATVRGRRVFGENKTVRGFVAIVPASAVLFATLSLAARQWPAVAAGLWPLTPLGYAALGAWGGFGLMLGELPNSFMKRQLGIAPGEAPRGRVATVIGFVVDRLDSVIGMLVAITLAAPTPWVTWLWVLLLGPGVHWSFSVLLYRLGVKARPA